MTRLILLAAYLTADYDSIAARVINFDKFLHPNEIGHTKILKLENDTTYCSSSIGCINKLPNTTPPYGSEALKTEFTISTLGETQTVSFIDAGTCPRSLAQICPYDLGLLKSSPFKSHRRTVIIIPGYSNKKDTCWPCDMASIWHRLDVNVIRVHWDTGMWYDIAMAKTKFLARQITLLIYYLAQAHGVEVDDNYLENIYIIGHSLGAHVAGFVGQDYEGRLGRITGLDPAGPGFLSQEPRYRLDRSDALLVDVIHTNADRSMIKTQLEWDEFGVHWGTIVDSGHVDLYANNGKYQPGCVANMYPYCSHSAAVNYYLSILSNSVDGRESSLAYRSNNYEDFSNGRSFEDSCRITSVQKRRIGDLVQCSIPVDYLISPSEYRKLLTDTFRLNLNENNRFYFLTFDSESHPKHNYLLQINIRKNWSPEKAVEFGCDFSAAFVMRDGLTKSKSSFSRYKLMEHTKDLYKILVPFVTALDHSTSDSFEDAVAKFPSMIVVSGLTESRRGSWWSRMKADKMGFVYNSLRSMVTRNSPYCDLSIESVSVHLMKMPPLTAHYSLRDDPYEVIKSDTIEDTRIELNHSDEERIARLYLTKVILPNTRNQF